MNVSSLRLAILAGLTVSVVFSSPVFADQISDLKAELMRQKELAAQQQARLEALESKLNAALDVQRAVAESEAKDVKAAPKIGDGLRVTYGKDTIQLYGLLDLTIRSTSNVDSAGHSVTKITTGYLSGSRWGIQGSHNLGLSDPSASIIYKLESEYEIATGALDTDNVLFNRDAWIGYQSDSVGRVTFGRQNTLGRDFAEIYGIAFSKHDVDVTEGGWTNNNVSKNGIFYLASPTGTRYDNGVVWKRKFGDFVGGAAYQFGGVPGARGKNASEALALAYNQERYALAAEYNQSDIDGLKHSTYTFGGNILFGPFRLNAGYYHYTADQAVVGKRKDDDYTLSGSYKPEGSKFEYYLGYEAIRSKNAGYSPTGFTLGAFHDTTLVTSAGSGHRDSAYAAILYRFDKRADFYLAVDEAWTSGAFREAAAHGFNNVFEYGGGLRLRF